MYGLGALFQPLEGSTTPGQTEFVRQSSDFWGGDRRDIGCPCKSPWRLRVIPIYLEGIALNTNPQGLIN